MNIPAFDQPTSEKIVQEWLTALSELIANVSKWVKDQPGWSVEPSTKEITEEALGSYIAPVLTINATEGRLILEPMARIVIGGTGTVELYAWPALYRVRLLHRVREGIDTWVVLTDSRVILKEPWNEETFLYLVQSLLGEQ